MIETYVVAAGAISALGRGRSAYTSPADAAANEQCPPTNTQRDDRRPLRHDEELARRVARVNPASSPPQSALHASGARARRVLVGRVPDEYLTPSTGDRAEDLLIVAARELALNLERTLPDFRSRRILALVGTSAGGMPSLERALAARERSELTSELAVRASYCAPTRCLSPILGLPELRILSVLAACASSTLAVGLGCRLLESGRYDLVIAGGYDALSPFVWAGFDALGALTRTAPRPFNADRDGMALGEGAALLALALPSSSMRVAAGESSLVGRVWGFGASSDAVHVTAPDPQGFGLSRAALTALADAGLPSSAVEWVSAHATATVLNDAAEARALLRIFDGETPSISAWKAVIGHTLGAAGGLECLAAWEASAQRSIPAPSSVCPASVVSTAAASSALPATVFEESSALPSLRGGPCLKLSAAFGGCNAALVLADARAERSAPAPSRALHPVRVRGVGPRVTAADMARVLALAPARAELLARADRGSELVLTAAATALSALGELPEDAAVVVATYSASLEVNEIFDQRRRAGKPVEPRRFPATSPNLGAGLCTIAFELHGPSFAISCEQSLGVAALEIAEGVVASDASAALLVFVEDVGAAVQDLLRSAGRPERPRVARALILERGSEPAAVEPFWERWPAE